MSPYIYHSSKGFRGSAAKTNLEKLFRLLDLFITQPHKDKDALQDWKEQKRLQLNYNQQDVSQRFAEMVDSMLALPQLYPYKITTGDIENINIDSATSFFINAFSNWKNFTFVLTGDIDSAALDRVINYISCLPTAQQSVAKNINNSQKMLLPLRNIVNNGTIADKVNIQLVNFGTVPANNANLLKLAIAELALKYILLNRLREKEGATYSVSSTITAPAPGDSICTIRIGFDCSVNMVDRMISAVEEELALLKKSGFSDSLFMQCKNAWVHEYNMNDTSPGWWLNYFTGQYKSGGDILSYYKQRSLLSSLSLAEMRDFFASFLPDGSFRSFIQLPAGGTK